MYLDEKGKFQPYAWPGGYQLLYLCADDGVLCPDCANEDGQTDDPDDPQWHIVDGFVNWEGPPTICDNCNKSMESEYGEIDEN